MKYTHITYILLSVLCVFSVASCSSVNVTSEGTISKDAEIYPDYRDVTVPCNIAPMNFNYIGPGDAAVLSIEGVGQIKADKDGLFKFSKKIWNKIIAAKGAEFTVMAKIDGKYQSYNPFRIEVSDDEIDQFLVYRLIPPGYQGWKDMGIYQRDLSSYEQTVVLANNLTSEGCMNCHSFNMRNPEQMVFHTRSRFAGTTVVDGDMVEKLNTKTDSTISNFVYPFWHPDGIHIAFSVNSNFQSFYSSHIDRIEVFDKASDIIVYNIKTKEITWSPLTKSEDQWEVSPCFSPDGKYLYFSSADPVPEMPDDHKDVRYSIKRIAFDAATETYGETLETVYDAHETMKSASFPRISPDGRYLAFTEQDFGYFAIWHTPADIKMLDLQSGTGNADYTVVEKDDMNSDAADSYHTWSGNSRWMVFSSRRDDGLYTRPYIAYVNEKGESSKAFMLPQKNPRKYYDTQMCSYNIPELASSKVKVTPHQFEDVLRNTRGTNVKVKQ